MLALLCSVLGAPFLSPQDAEAPVAEVPAVEVEAQDFGEPWPLDVIDYDGKALIGAEVIFLSEGLSDPFVVGAAGLPAKDWVSWIEVLGERTITDTAGRALVPAWDTTRGRMNCLVRWNGLCNVRQFKAPEPSGKIVKLRDRGSLVVSVEMAGGGSLSGVELALRGDRDGGPVDLYVTRAIGGVATVNFDFLDRFGDEVTDMTNLRIVQRGLFKDEVAARFKYGEWGGAPLKLKLRPTVSVLAKLVDPNGEPLRGAVEVVLGHSKAPDYTVPLVTKSTETGELTLAGVEAGLECYIAARRPGGRDLYGIEYTAPRASANPVELEIQDTGLVFIGRFVREDGRPIERQPVRAEYLAGNAIASNGGVMDITPAREGRFQLLVEVRGRGQVRTANVSFTRIGGDTFPELKYGWSMGEAVLPGIVDLGDVVLAESGQ